MILSMRQTRIGAIVEVDVESTLAGQGVTVYYHWYVDGQWRGDTRIPCRAFHIPPGEQVCLDVLDTLDPDFDALANAPPGYPARRTLQWVRSLDPDVVYYAVEQLRAAGAWTCIGQVNAEPGRWAYEFTPSRLDDGVVYQWRVVPYDIAGNRGSPATLNEERIVRLPDAPIYTVSLNESRRLVFASAES